MIQRRCAALCTLLLLLLAVCTACGGTRAGTAQTTEPSATVQRDPALCGTWNNAGEYENGGSYLEILTLREDGGAEVTLIYNDEPTYFYEGSYTVAGSRLTVTFFMNGQDTEFDYRYKVDGTVLTLQDEDGEYTYLRE